jgi:ferredoxin-NADP reductase/MOSC domain-containing protein YiiM
MQIVSINSGHIKPLAVQGDNIQTGFFKQPRLGPVRVKMNGIQDDKRVSCAADPNRAVFFYQSAYYDLWRAELKRDILYGTLGENIAFDGPENSQFFLGDVLKLGSARVQITHPRFPCRSLSARMNEPDFALRYLKSGRLGFFCRVIEEGVVSAEDEIEVVHREIDPYPLDEFARVTYLEPRDVEGIKRLLAVPGLVPNWRIQVERQLRRVIGDQSSWTTLRPLKVSRRHMETPDVVSLDFEAVDGSELPAFEAGQFLTVQLDAADKKLTRTYTLTGRSANGRGYSISVKREPKVALASGAVTGLGSNCLHDAVKENDLVQALAPRGHFVVEPGSRPVVLVSAGIGATPMLAMLRHLTTCPLGREAWYVHVARDGRQHAFDVQVRALTDHSKLLHRYVKYSQPAPADRLGSQYDASGRLKISDLEKLVPGLNADFYVCGPTQFMQDIIRGLVARGVSKEQLHYEFFGAGAPVFNEPAEADSTEPVLDQQGKPIVVTFAKSGVTLPWTRGSFSLLSLAEKNGLRPEASCRSGLCNLCMCRLDSGDVTYIMQTANTPPAGEVLICCSRPTTSVMLDA